MTEIKCKTIGGITYNLYAIKSSHHFDDEYVVVLKDGTTLKYQEQDFHREAEVVIDKSGRIDFKGLSGVTITDTKENDIYRLMGCENVLLKADRIEKDKDGNVILSDSDFVQLTHRRLVSGEIQYSKGNRLELNKSDLYALPEDANISFVFDEKEIVS